MDGQRRHREVDELGQADTEKQPEQAAQRGEGDGLAEEEGDDGAPWCAKGDEQADFAGALADRDGHDGADTDAADEQ